MELSTNQKGAIAEAQVMAEAVRLGFEVARPLVEGRRYDLVIDTGQRLWRVQCKWAPRRGDVLVVRSRTSRYTPNGYVRTTYTAAEIDAVAVYSPDTERCYLLPIAMLDGKGHTHLRLAPARNNQSVGLLWAADYDFGAIAQLGERLTGSQEVEGSSPSSSMNGSADPYGRFRP